MSEFGSITEAFLYLTSNISKQLQNVDFLIIRRACIEQINTPNGVQLAPDTKKYVKKADNLNALLDTLADSPYWSWIDLRLLKAMVAASGTSKSLIVSYERQVFSKKLSEVIPSIPSKKQTDKCYTKIVTKFNKDLEEITIFDLLERKSILETVIMDLKSGTCSLAHIAKGCIEIHWYIPTDYTDHVYRAASLKRQEYHALHLLFIQIGAYEKIYNPSIVGSSATPKPPLPDDVGMFSG